MKYDNTYVIVDLDIIAENFRAIAQKAGVPVMAVVKANAYGHGAVQIARRLEDSCAFFGVSSMLEALELRNAGIQTPILILGATPSTAYKTAIRQGIRLTVYRYEDALALSEAARETGKTALFHFAVDTGMGRLGFQPTEADADICAEICRLPGLTPEGLFSHFATADSADLTKARAQAERFDAFDRMLKQRGVEVKLRHMDNSAGIMNFASHYELVRAGIIIYGLYPSSEVDPGALQLRPALSWHSRIIHVKTLEAGYEIGYGGTFVTEKPTVVATVPVGYADGYKRSLSNRFYVLIRGKKAPILGRICMDYMMVDVTDIPDAAVGDTVVLIGSSGELTITVEEVAETAHTFNYEFICGIGRRVPRYYQENGEIIHQAHYLLDIRT